MIAFSAQEPRDLPVNSENTPWQYRASGRRGDLAEYSDWQAMRLPYNS
jgi:hypothetical protein